MREQPRYGVYLWWPSGQDTGWVHPEDVALVEQLIPSDRVFLRGRLIGRYQELHYGPLRLRIQPVLYLPVDGDGFDVGDQVEICSLGGQNDPFVGVIQEMRWDRQHRRIQYQVSRLGEEGILPRVYLASDLQQLERKDKLRIRED